MLSDEKFIDALMERPWLAESIKQLVLDSYHIALAYAPRALTRYNQQADQAITCQADTQQPSADEPIFIIDDKKADE